MGFKLRLILFYPNSQSIITFVSKFLNFNIGACRFIRISFYITSCNVEGAFTSVKAENTPVDLWGNADSKNIVAKGI